MRDRLPQILVSIALVALLLLGFSDIFMPTPEDTVAERDAIQDSWESHDPTTSYEHASDHVGDNSNTVALMTSMPVGKDLSSTQINGTDVVFTLESQTEGTQFFEENMTYSAVGFLGLVDNATSVTLTTMNSTYTFTRESVQSALGQEVKLPLSRADWEVMRERVPQLWELLLSAQE